MNLLPLRLIFIRTYERDSDRERLREDVLPRFRVLILIYLLIPKVVNVYEKGRFIFLIVDDILCK